MKLKKTFTAVTATALSLTMAFAFTACGNNTEKDPVITEIALSETSLELDTGESKTLRVTATYDDESTKTLAAKDVEWSTSSAAIATVSYGAVSGVAKGEATITAKVGEYTKTCSVTVHSLTITLDQTEIDVERGTAGVQLTATVLRDGAAVANPEIEWTTSDEAKVTVTNGLVAAWAEGTATVTAKLPAGQTATCKVNAHWTKPVGYKEMEFAEQNKLHPGAWGYWYAKETNWNAGLAHAYQEGTYTANFTESPANLKDGYEYIGMGKAAFEYDIESYLVPYGYQIFFRSSDNFTDDEGVQGKLKYNHNYAISLKVKSNQTGTIHVNPYDDIRAKGAGEGNEEETVEQYNAYLLAQQTAGKIQLAKDSEGKYLTNNDGVYKTNHDFDIKAGEETEINVIFRHDDCGYIYATNVYDNMGTALHIQLADLAYDKEAGESYGRTEFEVWDVQFKDLGAADNPVECDETKHAGWVDPNAPVVPEKSPVMSLEDSPKATKASLAVSEDETKALFVLEGTVDLSKFDNDAEKAQAWLYGAYLDLQIADGNWDLKQFSREATVDAAAGTFVIKYDITYLPVSTGNGSEAYGGHFTEKEESEPGYGDNHYRDLKLDTEHAVPDQSVTVGEKKYTLVNHYGSDQMSENWGCVAVKVEKVG